MDIATLREKHPDHWMKAAAIRTLTLDAVAAAKSGHSGMPMGMADVATVLFTNHMRFDPTDPRWPNRDRFVLSAGHGSMLLYSLLYLTGYADMTIEEIRNFRQWGSKTAGHPEYHHAEGIETTTGPLGQGVGNSVGFAMAEEHLRARWGSRIIDHHTYVMAGDGCLMEGISQEALALAGRQKLSRLILMWDNNGITIDGKVSIADRTDQEARFAASGWDTFHCDGHDPDDIERALTEAKASPGPAMIACKTHIALGSALQDTSKGHGVVGDPKMIADTKAIYGWTAPAFEVPKDIKAAWEEVGAKGADLRRAWEGRHAAMGDGKRKEFDRSFAGEVPAKLSSVIRALKKQAVEGPKAMATRAASEMVLEVVNPVMKETLGGSADLTGSNNTKTSDLGIFDVENREGRYIYYGIREHGMASAMNGLILHGGVRPYGGTFMCFTDYARPAMRLSALMGVPVIYVMSHDSIGLGEDGPTHQPVEHLAISRATPGMMVFRPADLVETAEAWELALGSRRKPSVMALSRQSLKPARSKHQSKNMVAMGAYVMREAEAKRQAILMATGSEVEIALAAREMLEAEGIGTRVVSMPCWELFNEQDEAYRRKVLPPGPVRVAIEAAARFGWDQWLYGQGGRRDKGDFVGMEGFGASAPAEDLYKQFGITPQATVDRVKALLGV